MYLASTIHILPTFQIFCGKTEISEKINYFFTDCMFLSCHVRVSE